MLDYTVHLLQGHRAPFEITHDISTSSRTEEIIENGVRGPIREV